GTDAAEVVMPPVLEEACGLGGDLPVIWIRPVAPQVDMMPELVDDGSLIVLLFLSGEPFAFVKNQVLLIHLSLALPRLRNWRDEFGATAGFDDLLCRLALVIKLPVADRVVIGRVQDRPFEELVVHYTALPVTAAWPAHSVTVREKLSL